MSLDIINTVQRFFAAVDGRDWNAAETLMSNPFFLDYSSFGGPEGAELAPADILLGWKAMLPGFDATHHHLGPLDIHHDDETATVRVCGTATHQMADTDHGDLWTVYGDYVLALVKDGSWKLSGNTFNFKFQSGNADLPRLAQERAA